MSSPLWDAPRGRTPPELRPNSSSGLLSAPEQLLDPVHKTHAASVCRLSSSGDESYGNLFARLALQLELCLLRLVSSPGPGGSIDGLRAFSRNPGHRARPRILLSTNDPEREEARLLPLPASRKLEPLRTSHW